MKITRICGVYFFSLNRIYAAKHLCLILSIAHLTWCWNAKQNNGRDKKEWVQIFTTEINADFIIISIFHTYIYVFCGSRTQTRVVLMRWIVNSKRSMRSVLTSFFFFSSLKCLNWFVILKYLHIRYIDVLRWNPINSIFRLRLLWCWIRKKSPRMQINKT